MSCILRVGGPGFNVDHFLRAAALEPYRVDRKGERGSSRRLAAEPGVHFLVSDRSFDDLDGQVAEATAFLKAHSQALRTIVSFPGVESPMLDFGVAWRDVAVQVDRVSAELLRLAGELGIGLQFSHYPVSEPTDNEAAGA